MGIQIKYYVCGHTAKGLVNYLASNLTGINQIITLKHPSNLIKTKVLAQLINIYQEEKMEVIANPYRTHYMDGIILRNKRVAIISEKVLSAGIEPTLSLDLTKFITDEKDTEDMAYLQEIVEVSNEAAYRCFAKGLAYHEQLEEIYIQEMNFKEADRLADVFIAKLFHHQPIYKRMSKIKRRLFGTNTADGMVNHLQSLIDKVEHRVFIKGRAGTGKSVFMKKVLAACIEKGYHIEVYHCSFDPNSIDMVLIRELNYCLFDSTAPHELFPTRNSDEIIDLYEKTVTAFTDEKYSTKINNLTEKYKLKMKQGLTLLANTRDTHKMMDKMWKDVSNETIDAICKQIKIS